MADITELGSAQTYSPNHGDGYCHRCFQKEWKGHRQWNPVRAQLSSATPQRYLAHKKPPPPPPQGLHGAIGTGLVWGPRVGCSYERGALVEVSEAPEIPVALSRASRLLSRWNRPPPLTTERATCHCEKDRHV